MAADCGLRRNDGIIAILNLLKLKFVHFSKWQGFGDRVPKVYPKVFPCILY